MAQTTGIMNGSQVTIMFGDAGASPTYVVVDNVTDLSASLSVDTRDTTTKNNGGYKALLPGLKSLSVNFSAMYADDATQGFAELMTAYNAGTKQAVKVTSYDFDGSAENTGDHRLSFDAYITSVEWSAGTEDNATYSCTMECVSTITYEAIS
jgi:predicted secreted protein